MYRKHGELLLKVRGVSLIVVSAGLERRSDVPAIQCLPVDTREKGVRANLLTAIRSQSLQRIAIQQGLIAVLRRRDTGLLRPDLNEQGRCSINTHRELQRR